MTEEDIARWSAWDRFVEATPDTGFMQSSSWATFRSNSGFGHFAVTLKDGDKIVGGAVVGKRAFEPGRCFYYIQDGPVLPADEADAAEVFGALIERIERHRQAEGDTVSHLRIEPRWTRLPSFLRGFQPAGYSRRYAEPRSTLYIDLRHSEDAILAQMKPKGRYNVRVARRHGVRVVEDNSHQALLDFIRIHRRTAERQKLDHFSPRYFQNLLTEFASRRKIALFFAEYGGRRLATALVVTCGRRATYLFGGSLVLHRRVMAPYLLQFEIMRWAKARGCDWYDLWGVAPPDQQDHAWKQISDFKRKLGGVEVQLVPTLDCVYDAVAYERFRTVDVSDSPPPVRLKPPPQQAATGSPTQAGAVPPALALFAKRTLADVKVTDPALPRRDFDALRRTFPLTHFQRLQKEGFRFYQTTFWYPLDRAPENVFESIVRGLQPLAIPSAEVIGVEWWFSVLMTNSTPQWLLPCHFDRNDLDETEIDNIRHPDTGSVLFLNSVPYGELVVTDQVLTFRGTRPEQPKDMRFIHPKVNRYAVFPGHLYHGVLGRMSRPLQSERLRVTMAVNWWTERPKAAYLRDSRECMQALRLRA
jgi:lipid II:glycine glycyltransferase (peptidoglycan interpeptide bridge formation enzyme)